MKEIDKIIQQNKDKPAFIRELWETINKLSSQKDLLKKDPPKPEPALSRPNFRIGSAKSRPTSGITDSTSIRPEKEKKDLPKEQNQFFSEESTKKSISKPDPQADELNLDFVLEPTDHKPHHKLMPAFSKPKPHLQPSPNPKPPADITNSLFLSGLDQPTARVSVPGQQQHTRTAAPDGRAEPTQTQADELPDIDAPNTVVLRIRGGVSGQTGEIGLAQLRLFDAQGRCIEVRENGLHLQGVQQNVLHRLVCGTPYAVDSKEMFRMDFPLLASFVDLRIRYTGADPGHLRIWNYNGAAKNVGVGELEVIVNEKSTGTFKLTTGPGLPDVAYSQDIPLFKLAPGGSTNKVKAPPLEQAPISKTKSDDVKGVNSRRQLQDTKQMNAIQQLQMEGGKAKVEEVIEQPKGVKEYVTRRGSAFGSGTTGTPAIDLIRDGTETDEVPNRKPTDQKIQSLQERRNEAKLKQQGIAPPKEPEQDRRTLNTELDQGKVATSKKDSHPNPNNFTRRVAAKPDPKPQITETFGLESQLIKLEDSLLVPIEKPAKLPASNLPTRKPDFVPTQTTKDALDCLEQADPLFAPLRHFDRRNISKIELSGLDWPEDQLGHSSKKPTSGTLRQDVAPVIGKQSNAHSEGPKAQNKPSMSAKPVSQPCDDLGDRFAYSSFPALVADHEYFCVPELPRGQVLEFDLFSNWGDKFYIGLCGIELFDETGRPIRLDAARVSATPSSLNSLPDIQGDPRTVDKLVDGVYLTTDEKHFWLAPFSPDKPARVRVDTGRRVTLSLIRIWNYNRDRVHSARGVREFAIRIDGVMMFFGELRRASGHPKRIQDNCEWISLCEETLHDAIAVHDWLTREPEENLVESKAVFAEEIRQSVRPTTSSRLENPDGIEAIKRRLEYEKQRIQQLSDLKDTKKVDTGSIAPPEATYVECSKLSIQILENWGDPAYVGLTGLEFFDPDDRLVQVTADMLNARPRDIASELGTGDVRVLSNLVNGVNITNDTRCMWLTPFVPKSSTPSVNLYINFEQRVKLAYMKVWNYNKSPEDSFRGVKKIEIAADLNKISTGFVFLKKAPGLDDTEYCQIIRLPPPKSRPVAKLQAPDTNWLPQFSVPPRLPCGFTITFWLLSTWGDPSYIGLKAIEVYDRKGKALFAQKTQSFSISADPPDVSILPDHREDSRGVTNLANVESQGANQALSWLSPFINPHLNGAPINLGRQRNTLTISFKNPTAIAAIRIWNYSKTPSRGAKEFVCMFDDHIVFTVVLWSKHRENSARLVPKLERMLMAE